MKARIARPEKVVLYYGISGERKSKLLEILEREKTRAVEVGEDDLGRKVGYLAAWKGFSSDCEEVEEKPTQEMIVMCGIDRQQMSRLLGLLRENALSIPLKAVATPTNQSWSFAALAHELWREHQNLGG